MINKITVSGGKEVKLAANAATPFRYKQLFNKDLLRIFRDSSEDEAENVMLADICTELAFIMNRQAEGANMNALSMDDFYTWLEDYEAMDFVMGAEDIINIYLASTKTTVDAKKNPK